MIMTLDKNGKQPSTGAFQSKTLTWPYRALSSNITPRNPSLFRPNEWSCDVLAVGHAAAAVSIPFAPRC